jgi:hypothetical protein
MESASELLGVGSREHEIYKRRCEGKGGFWLAFDVTVRTAARNHKRRNGVAWEVWETERLPHPVPVLLFDCICPSRSGNANASPWKGLAERRRSKNKVENIPLRSTKAAGVFTMSKSKNALAHSPKRHMGSTHAQSMYLLPWLASPADSWRNRPNPGALLTDTPSKDWHLMYPEPAALPSTKPVKDIRLCHDSCKC